MTGSLPWDATGQNRWDGTVRRHPRRGHRHHHPDTGRLLLQLLGAFADYERSLLRERVVAGVRRAQASGKHCGCPRKELDLRPALALLDEGRGLKDVARILKVPRATLRRRLDEAGRWPVGRQAA